MDDIRDISNSTGTEQNTGTQQQNMYGQYEGYGQRSEPQEDMFPTAPVKQKKKITLPAIIMVLIVIAVVIVGLITLGPAYSAARKYGKALVKGNDLDKVSEMVFPEKLIKNGDEVYESYTGVVKDSIDEIKDLGDAKFSGVKLGKKIKSNDLRNIEKYYKVICKFADTNISVNIEKGYESEIRFKAGGNNYYQKCCVIKMRGEGWKIFPGSLSELQTAMIMLNSVDDLEF